MAKGDRIVLTQNLYTVGENDIAKMPARVEREVQDELYKLGRETRDLARSYCPRKTGALQASIYVTRGAGTSETAGPGSPFTRQSTAGYFRAINAAIRRRPHQLFTFDSEIVNQRTQRPLASSGGMDGFSTFNAGVSKVNGMSFRSYSAGESFGSKDVGAKRQLLAKAGYGGTKSVFGELEKEGGSVGFKSTEFATPAITEMGAAGRRSFFVSVGAAAHYAGDVEFGHIMVVHGNVSGHVEARPFMRPALAWAKSQLNARVTAAFKRGLAK